MSQIEISGFGFRTPHLNTCRDSKYVQIKHQKKTPRLEGLWEAHFIPTTNKKTKTIGGLKRPSLPFINTRHGSLHQVPAAKPPLLG